jgi:hypothetical protein
VCEREERECEGTTRVVVVVVVVIIAQLITVLSFFDIVVPLFYGTEQTD